MKLILSESCKCKEDNTSSKDTEETLLLQEGIDQCHSDSLSSQTNIKITGEINKLDESFLDQGDLDHETAESLLNNPFSRERIIRKMYKGRSFNFTIT